METLPVDKDNPDPDRLARLAMVCVNRVVLDCKRIIFWLEGPLRGWCGARLKRWSRVASGMRAFLLK